MTSRYLLHFVQEHISFRWTEFVAITSRNNCKFKLISKPEHVKTRPFIIIELDDDDRSVNNLIGCAKSSYLLKDLYELWAQSNKSVDDLAEQVESTSKQYKSGLYSKPDQCFRVNVENFNSKLNQSDKIIWIQKMAFFDSFQAKPNLSNPKQIYCIIEMSEKNSPSDKELVTTKEYYFCRHLTQGGRNSISLFSLKTRKFIANTSMDPTLSFLTANAAKIKQNDIVYDPFVGSGSLLVAAAHLGAYVLGSDIDWPLLHGKSRPSRVGQSKREKDEMVRANFKQYNLEHRYLDVMVADITRKSIRNQFKFDAIIADPPYGVREGLERIGADRKKIERPQKDENVRIRYPRKTHCDINVLLTDLLLLSVNNLKLGGRLVYYLPVIKTDHSFDDYIPQHPYLKMISYCEQALTNKLSRLMVIMEKIEDLAGYCEERSEVRVPQLLSDMNFRETYFTKSS